MREFVAVGHDGIDARDAGLRGAQDERVHAQTLLEARALVTADVVLEVHAFSNDLRRTRPDLADVERLLRMDESDLERVREYFRIFEREKELEALLATVEEWER